MWFALASLFAVTTAVLAVIVGRQRRQLSQIGEQAERLQASAAELAREVLSVAPLLLRVHWVEWWCRNVAEMTPLDPARPAMERWAAACLLVDDLNVFVGDLQAIAADPARDAVERDAARAWAAEFHAPELPWVVWARDTQKPPHAAYRLREEYARLMGPGIRRAPFGPDAIAPIGDN